MRPSPEWSKATQTIIVKEFVTSKGAHHFCERNAARIEQQWGGRVKAVANQIDTGCFHVELVGEFGREISLHLLR